MRRVSLGPTIPLSASVVSCVNRAQGPFAQQQQLCVSSTKIMNVSINLCLNFMASAREKLIERSLRNGDGETQFSLAVSGRLCKACGRARCSAQPLQRQTGIERAKCIVPHLSIYIGCGDRTWLSLCHVLSQLRVVW